MSPDVGSPPRSRGARIAAALLPRLAFYPFLLGSLLVFPGGLPWMIVGWLLIFAFRLCRGKSGWPPLALCIGILLVKRPDWSPTLVALALLMMIAAALDRLGTRPAAFRTASLLLLPAWLVLTWTWMTTGVAAYRREPAERPVAVVGDSIASGGFIRILEQRLAVPVIDGAQGGITSGEGLERLREILPRRPQAVVIEIGGHDYLRGKKRSETKANLERMIDESRQAGADVFLFEIPRGFITDPFAGLERELARRAGVVLIHDDVIRQLVLFSPFTPLGSWTGRQLSYDGLHPNDAGNLYLAERVEAELRRVYGPGILRGALNTGSPAVR